ncbi:ribosomal maturation YjgA family protein [Apibacter adventoris]|uniref:ribosomal maturation YjgA family protein n=1 Tax=Apibacter adventoris TaxID=1679466 RepID=UPI000CF6E5B7|nr:DUF2809 domain-containing protein [Apibacter adventoris]PQL96058.1 DUF2809 domain-containing protein [Apibacter adventoris]
MEKLSKINFVKLRFSIYDFLLSVLFFLLEIFIGLFVKDHFIRPWGGDFLVIFLIYYFIKAFVKIPSLLLIFLVLMFACLVEISQYFHIVDILEIKNKILRIAIGNSFSWGDILVYILGAITCYYFDSKIFNKKGKISN